MAQEIAPDCPETHDGTCCAASAGETRFVPTDQPAPRLFLVGATSIALTLAPMATLAGYAVTVIDPRAGFATAARFPGCSVVVEWPGAALARLLPDAGTALVTLGHDPKLDDPALAAGLRSPAFYIGALGSTRTHAARLERLQAQGFCKTDLARIHGPVGLPLGGRAPAEIAVSALAEMIQVRSRNQTA